jgi:hypothetical protein
LLSKIKKKIKDKLFSEQWDEEVQSSDDAENSDPNTDIERKLAALIGIDINNAKTSKEDATDDLGWSIEEQWDDEYKMLKGGGLQWKTNIAYRDNDAMQVRPNSEDNFIHPAISIATANITASPTEVTIKGKKKHEKHAQSITHISRFNDQRNEFNSTFKEMVTEFIAYGPLIAKVIWDGEWMGGSGPDRWVGDVKIEHVRKEDCLFDSSVLDLKSNMNKCKYVGFKSRQSIRYVQDRWNRFGKHISAEVNDDELINEGIENENVTLYEMYYRGFPEYMSEDRIKELKERTAVQEEQGDSYKAKDLYDMANGNLEGVHLAYYCNDILLEYIPYVYDHGKYPCVFTTRYNDPKNQWGYGEIRNAKIPNILHNKGDEIEIEAMSREGLGGGYYNTGAITKKQLDNILQNGSRGGMWFEVAQVNQIQERTGVKVPTSITNYKEHKQRMVETISSNTPINQGQLPSANMPFKAIAELGARSDVKTKQAADLLKDFLIGANKLRIELFAQFYTEERYYRYTGSNDEVIEGTFNQDEIFDVWARETEEEPILDEMGQPALDEMGQPMTQQVEKMERFVPDFDIEVTILSKKPDDRNYYTSLAMDLNSKGMLTFEDLLYTLEEGKLPSNEDIIQHVQAQNVVMSMISQVQQLPLEIQDQAKQVMQQTLQDMMQQFAQQNMQGMATNQQPQMMGGM